MKIIFKRETDFLKIKLTCECLVSKIREKMKIINLNFLLRNKQTSKIILSLNLKLIKFNNKNQKLLQTNIEVFHF
jgi:hypothetical protein